MRVFLIVCGSLLAYALVSWLIAAFMGFNDRDDGNNAV